MILLYLNSTSLIFLGIGIVGLAIIVIVVYLIGQASKPTPRPNVFLFYLIFK